MAKYRVQNPATGEILETFESATDAQIEQAVAAADTVYREWREKSVQERANVVKRAAEIFAERREELARLIAVEMGKSIAESLDEVDFATDIIESAIAKVTTTRARIGSIQANTIARSNDDGIPPARSGEGHRRVQIAVSRCRRWARTLSMWPCTTARARSRHRTTSRGSASNWPSCSTR